MLIGERKLQARIRRIARIDMPKPAGRYDHELHYLLVSLGIPASSTGNQVQFHRDAEAAREDLWLRIEQARESIDIEVFIFRPDSIGRQLMKLLQQKLDEGVKVRLLVDDVGSFELTRWRLRDFQRKGGQVARFMPVVASPLRSRHNLRDHRKLVIVDGQWVWSGGRNLADEYLQPEEQTHWIDLSFSQSGGAVSVYQSVFESDWHFAHQADPLVHVPVPPSSASSEGRVQVLPSGPDVADDPIHAALLTACYSARERIRIVTPYYIPDDGVQQALRLAHGARQVDDLRRGCRPLRYRQPRHTQPVPQFRGNERLLQPGGSMLAHRLVRSLAHGMSAAPPEIRRPDEGDPRGPGAAAGLSALTGR